MIQIIKRTGLEKDEWEKSWKHKYLETNLGKEQKDRYIDRGKTTFYSFSFKETFKSFTA